MLTKAPKGTKDILPSEIHKWQYIAQITSQLCKNFGYKEIRTPVFEHTELFQRGVGDATDIVQKEMYTFLDKAERSITLRPEGTAGAVRSYIEHGMASLPQPTKLYYYITAYRYENVQKGRYREHNQFGVEVFGADGPSTDVEIISLLSILFEKLGLTNIDLNINSIGCPECRKGFTDSFKEFIRSRLDNMCDTCKVRYEKNPMRILDCKEEKCKSLTEEAPCVIDNLCDECKDHFEGLKTGLRNLGIKYNIDPRIVRGQDYYTKTVFEFVSKNVGTQGTICGGGRYDGLIETCGGKPTPGVGFGLGIERLLMEIDSQGIQIPEPEGIELYIATMGEEARKFAQRLVFQLRSNGISAEFDHMDRSLKAQMKYADKMGAFYSIVLGDNEIDNNKAVLKDMRSGEQKDVSLDTILDRFRIILECNRKNIDNK